MMEKVANAFCIYFLDTNSKIPNAVDEHAFCQAMVVCIEDDYERKDVSMMYVGIPNGPYFKVLAAHIWTWYETGVAPLSYLPPAIDGVVEEKQYLKHIYGLDSNVVTAFVESIVNSQV